MHYRARGVGRSRGNPPAGALPAGAPLGQTRARQRAAASSVGWVLAQTLAVNTEGRRQGGGGGGEGGAGGERYKRLFTSRDPLLSPQVLHFFHLPLVAPSTSCSQFIWYVVGISPPGSFSFSCMWFCKDPRCLLSVLRRSNHQVRKFCTGQTSPDTLTSEKGKKKTTGCVSQTGHLWI